MRTLSNQILVSNTHASIKELEFIRETVILSLGHEIYKMNLEQLVSARKYKSVNKTKQNKKMMEPTEELPMVKVGKFD